MRKEISNGKSIMQIQEMKEDLANVALTMSDFEAALKNISKSVSQGQLKEYEEWMSQFGSV